MKIFFYIKILFVFTMPLISQDYTIVFSGIVRDTLQNVLPFASLRVEGTSLGTVCDQNGKFTLQIKAGNYKVIVSYVGYKSSIVNLTAFDTNKIVMVRLFPGEIQLPEVIVNGENPAYPIIREAILRKKNRKKFVSAFKVATYTKDKLGADTAIAMLSEAYSDIYWQTDDSLREIVTNRRQSGNFPEQIQFAKVDNFINFNDDNITFLNHIFVAPLAEDAFSHYDFLLQKIFFESDRKYFEIEIIPKTQLQPLFYGTIVIQDSNFALQKITLHPNSSFKIPFFEIVHATISQQFSLYQNRFWFPLEYHIIGEGYPSIAAISSQKKTVYYSRSVICYDYEFNINFPDSISSLPSLTLLTKPVATDSLHWATVKYFPLLKQEENAYIRIDSITKRKNWSTAFINFVKEYQAGFRNIDFHYNRVEGLYTGAKLSDAYFENFRIATAVGIGIADKQVKYFIKPEILLCNNGKLWFGVKYYCETQTFPLNYATNKALNFLTTLFNGKDYYDYFYAKGTSIYLAWEKFSSFLASIHAVVERHQSAQKNTDFSLNSLFDKQQFPENPSINNGIMKAIKVELHNQQWQPAKLFEEPQNMWSIRVEKASSDFGSEYNFTSALSSVSFRIPTMGITRLFNPYLGIYATLGNSWGSVPIQKTFAIESPLSGYVSPGSFRTAKNTEFSGDNFYAISVEHNFRNIPFILLGVPYVNFDVIIRAATNKMWIKTEQLKNMLQPQNKNYNEYTVGIGRVLDIMRIDFSFSEYDKSRYAVTVTGSM